MSVHQLEEYDSTEGNSLGEEDLVDSNNSEDENMMEDSKGLTRFRRNASEDNCSNGASSSSEEDEILIEYGLRFETCADEEIVRRIEIVTVGHRDSGKTQLIESVFGDHPSFTFKNRHSRDEYHIYLSEEMLFHIWIYDVKEAEFVRKADFRSKTVFFFCYDVDDLETLKDLEESWLPLFSNNFDKTMFYFLVSINRDPENTPKAVDVANSQDNKMAIGESIGDYFSDCLGCSIDDKESLLNVFQTAIDAAYPRTSIG